MNEAETEEAFDAALLSLSYDALLDLVGMASLALVEAMNADPDLEPQVRAAGLLVSRHKNGKSNGNGGNGGPTRLTQTLKRTYENHRSYRDDALVMLRAGWVADAVEEIEAIPRAWHLWRLALVLPGQQQICVTYCRPWCRMIE